MWRRFFSLTACISICLLAWAKEDTVYLKDGRVIKGTIVEKNDLYIKIIQPKHGIPLVYWPSEIKKIDTDSEYSPDNAPKTAERYECEYAVYENTEFGFKISVPKNWKKNDVPSKRPVSDSGERNLLSRTVFTPYEKTSVLYEKNFVPYVNVIVFKMEDNKDLLRIFKDLHRKKAIAAKEQGTFSYRMKGPPVELSRGAQRYVQGSAIFVPGVSGAGVSGREITIIDNYFAGRGCVIWVALGMYSDELSRYSGINDKIVETFSLTVQ